MQHMGRGQRVLAMAFRKVHLDQKMSSTVHKLKRETVERDLIFAGFLLLDCPIKGDSKVRRQTSLTIIMILFVLFYFSKSIQKTNLLSSP